MYDSRFKKDELKTMGDDVVGCQHASVYYQKLTRNTWKTAEVFEYQRQLFTRKFDYHMKNN